MQIMVRKWATKVARHLPWRIRCRWIACELQALQSHQELFANAAYSVAADNGIYTIDDLLCSVENLQRHVGELAQQLAELNLEREFSRRGQSVPI